nr:FtsX-like permease family protein [Kibdelosporangium sp. MJ126-NF4]CEL14939.1 putative integral membrane protein [Kibdelosporangium sp. MJ126-NF4]CTQ93467.1 putative integral membrane protein [Kibdelosporangium sp. MJ126-NF4]
MRLARWANDLALGVRLAIGGGRTSRTAMIRLMLGAVGIGLAVLVLLVAASVGPARESREARASARIPDSAAQSGVDPLYLWQRDTEFHSAAIRRFYVRSGGPTAPLPPGVDRLPAPGEALVSPALADLLATPEAALLRARMPEQVTGLVGTPGMVKPTDLVAVVGAPSYFENGGEIRGFGTSESSTPVMTTEFFVVLVLGLVTLLIPVFVFIMGSARVAGAERDRRLAALRLVGSDARQVRRIASAESLVSAVVGLVLGGLLFMGVRSVAAHIVLADESFFPEDLVPAPPLVAAIVLVVPVLAVLATQFALRRVVIEPLSVVRQAKPVKRRAWWRLALLIVGAALLASVDREDPEPVLMAVGASMLLVGVPAVLPWLLDRCLSWWRGFGKPSWQLATRRLQLEAGTSARVVGGAGVVLAGAVALQVVLAGTAAGPDFPPEYNDRADLHTDDHTVDAVWATVRDLRQVTAEDVRRSVVLEERPRTHRSATVLDCAQVLKAYDVDRCSDGDVFAEQPGQFNRRTMGVATTPHQIQLPAVVHRLRALPNGTVEMPGELILTRGALKAVPGLSIQVVISLRINPGAVDAIEHLRNAMEQHQGRVTVSTSLGQRFTDEAKRVIDLRSSLMVGSVITLTLAALSLFVLAVEQIRERRKAIATLTATGVPVRTLARSVLWQNTIPMALAVVVAVPVGVTVAALFNRVTNFPLTVDWATIALLSTTAAVLVVLVTALTLPFLRGAARFTSLRTE